MEEMNKVSSVVTEKEGGARLETAAPSKTPMTGGKKAALVIGILLGVLVLAYLAACVVVQTVYGGTALPRTDVLGVDVSKMTEQEIVALWEKQGAQTVRDTKVSLTENDADIGSVSLEELGVTVTPEAAAVAAGASRRYESWGGGALAWLRGGWEYIHSWFAQTSAVPSFDVDSAALDTACEKLSASLNCTVVDGGYRLEKGEGLYITKPADGRMLDAPQLESDLAAMLQSGELTPVACVYEEKKAQTVDVQAIHDQLAGEKVEAVCDKETGKPTESRVGLSFDVTAVQAQLDAAPAGTEFLADAEVEFPTVSTEELEECMFRDVLGTYTTKCAGPWGRHQNIKLAAAAINGRIYNPGEEFWYNSAVGQRTAARGYQEAGVYEGGRTTTGIGGGICQVSSTIFNAVARANLEIVERSPHAWPSSYVNKGEDATVNWPNLDFKFKNNTDYPVFLITYYENRKMSAEIWGMTLGEGVSIDLESQVIRTMDPPTEVKYVYNAQLPYGTNKITVKARTGYVVETYKVWYKNGEEFKREILHTSTYKAYQQTVEYND